MIPVSDVIPRRTFPAITIVLILANGVNAAVTGELIPALADGICLWLFASTIEDRFGHLRAAIFFLLSAGAALVAAQTGWRADVAAAGTVAATIGAYLTLYPTSRILMLQPVPLSVHEAPAVVFLFFWLAVRILSLMISSPRAFAATGAQTVGAYLVAAVIGMVLAHVLSRPERARVEWWFP